MCSVNVCSMLRSPTVLRGNKSDASELKGSTAEMAETTETKTTRTNNQKPETAKTESAGDGRKPSEQALQAVDVAVGAAPPVADTVRETADNWRNAETRSREIETLQNRVKTL